MGDDPIRAGDAAPRTSDTAREAAAERLEGLATPRGALGGLGELAIWLAAVQDTSPPRDVDNVRAVVFAGDHGVAASGVSAYPREITALMVRAFLRGDAGVAVLARMHGVRLRVLDIAVDDALDDVPPDVRAHKIRRSSGPIHLEDAITADECRAALVAGAAVAREEVRAGADLLIAGDMGIGNTTPAAALVAATLGLPATEVTGRGTGISDASLSHKEEVVRAAVDRWTDRHDPAATGTPVDLLAAVGGADFAAGVGFLVGAVRARRPVLLDGLISVTQALLAERLCPGATAWFVAGHRSTEPAQSLALEKLGLTPLLDLGMRLGEGSGAVSAVPLVRSAAALLRQTGLLEDLA